MFSQFNIELLFRIASKYRLREFGVKRRREREREKKRAISILILPNITLESVRRDRKRGNQIAAKN
jgi:hypothetical protein